MATQDVTLVIVVAHSLEARPLIDHFHFKSVKSSALPHYADDHGKRLIVSGMGKTNAAAAVGYISGLLAAQTVAPGFVNFGIAGHGSLDLGSGLLISKVIDAGTEAAYYPTPISCGQNMAVLKTVDQPESNYAEDLAYDMEGSGFWQAASRYSTLDLVQLFKVVSDNAENDTGTVNKARIEAVLAGQLEGFAQLVTQLQALASHHHRRHAEPVSWQSLRQIGHLTVSEQHQLRRLCQRGAALGLDEALLALAATPVGSGKELLRAVVRCVEQPPVEQPDKPEEFS